VPAAKLASEWGAYRRAYIQDDGRVIDHSQDGVTTSEGQAYALARAAWLGDLSTFDRVLSWTRHNLQAADPHRLPAWRWGRRGDGTWGVIDENPASDADIWMAWALVTAGRRWDRPVWVADARHLMREVWETETSRLGARRVLLPGPWALGPGGCAPGELGPEPAAVIINPSYYMPFAFRLFAEVDPHHPWQELVFESYRLLDEVLTPNGAPDWVRVDGTTGQITAFAEVESEKAVSGYEALRVPWNLAADAVWYNEPVARRLMARLDPLAARLGREGRLPAVVRPDGSAAVAWESRALYGSLLPVAALRGWNVDLSTRVARPAGDAPGRSYYDDNWTWFGSALLLTQVDPSKIP
jgi:endoglucanase